MNDEKMISDNQVALSESDISNMINDAETAKEVYESRSVKYRIGKEGYHVPDYYKNHYKPTIKEFDDRITKLRAMRIHLKELKKKK